LRKENLGNVRSVKQEFLAGKKIRMYEYRSIEFLPGGELREKRYGSGE
jgi:hypothetical protein